MPLNGAPNLHHAFAAHGTHFRHLRASFRSLRLARRRSFFRPTPSWAFPQRHRLPTRHMGTSLPGILLMVPPAGFEPAPPRIEAAGLLQSAGAWYLRGDSNSHASLRRAVPLHFGGGMTRVPPWKDGTMKRDLLPEILSPARRRMGDHPTTRFPASPEGVRSTCHHRTSSPRRFDLALAGVYLAGDVATPAGEFLPLLFHLLTCARRPSAVLFAIHLSSARAAWFNPAACSVASRSSSTSSKAGSDHLGFSTWCWSGWRYLKPRSSLPQSDALPN